MLLFFPTDFTFTCPSDVIGPDIKVRGSNDGGNYLFLFDNLPFTCYGRVQGWSFWAVTNGGFRAGVYRPTGNSNEFTLIGETDIPSGHRINEAVTYSIEDESDWLEFQPGDIIGWRLYSGGGRIRFDSGGTELISVKYNSHSDTLFSTTSVGDVLVAPHDLERAYSFQAVLSPYGNYNMALLLGEI